MRPKTSFGCHRINAGSGPGRRQERTLPHTLTPKPTSRQRSAAPELGISHLCNTADAKPGAGLPSPAGAHPSWNLAPSPRACRPTFLALRGTSPVPQGPSSHRRTSLAPPAASASRRGVRGRRSPPAIPRPRDASAPRLNRAAPPSAHRVDRSAPIYQNLFARRSRARCPSPNPARTFALPRDW